jgi:hypothetical protein
MLKKILDNLDGLNDVVKGEYKQEADGKYHLQIEDDDAGPLKRAKEHEAGLRKIAERERDDARTQALSLQSEVETLRSQQNGDVQVARASLEKDYERKLGESKAQYETRIQSLEKTLRKVFVDDVAMQAAADISTVPDLIATDMKQRLQVEIVDGEPVTRVLTRDGKPSAVTIDELKEEYYKNEKYAPIMRAQGGSGSGADATPGKKGGGATKPLNEMNSKERAELLKKNPQEFNRLVAVAKKEAEKKAADAPFMGL